MKQEIRCSDCKNWFSYPVEWYHYSLVDRGYLEDGFQCENCFNDYHELQYYRQGIAELRYV